MSWYEIQWCFLDFVETPLLPCSFTTQNGLYSLVETGSESSSLGCQLWRSQTEPIFIHFLAAVGQICSIDGALWKTVFRSLVPIDYSPRYKPSIEPSVTFLLDPSNRRSETAIAFVKISSTHLRWAQTVTSTTLSLAPSSVSGSSPGDEDCRPVSSLPPHDSR